MNIHKDTIAYFTMEAAIKEGMPTYSGGLGVLAGDFLAAGAAMNIPLVGITLLHHYGYFFQKLDEDGRQIEMPDFWHPEEFLTLCPEQAEVSIENRVIKLKIWKYEIHGDTGYIVPVYYLDPFHPDNSESDQNLCYQLYADDPYIRLSQEIILGIGGVRALEVLGYNNIRRYHMNEGHASLLAYELLNQELQDKELTEHLTQAVETVRSKCVFTTHTPVPAGHDKFPLDLVKRLLDHERLFDIPNLLCCNQELNMTYLALNLSDYVNGVAKRHGEIASLQHAPYRIGAITNGVNLSRWISPSFRALFDKYIPGWEQDPFSLRAALGIAPELIWEAHSEEKKKLINFINHNYNTGLRQDVFTIGFARRSTGYKRADLLFWDIEKLKEIAKNVGPINCIFAGKAHPRDHDGKNIIQNIVRLSKMLENEIHVIYLPNYDLALAKLLVAGVDLWLNTPQRPMEASGTSGMKSAANGVPSLSILDGWWIEGCIEGITGWTIGEPGVIAENNDSAEDARSIYRQLEEKILPLFYHNRAGYTQVMSQAIALNGSFFNTQRMMEQYVIEAYF